MSLLTRKPVVVLLAVAAGIVLLRPAAPGTGVIAGTVPRSIAELAGITNMLSKELGSRNKVNVAYAVFDGFKNLRTAKQVRALRGTEAPVGRSVASEASEGQAAMGGTQ